MSRNEQKFLENCANCGIVLPKHAAKCFGCESLVMNQNKPKQRNPDHNIYGVPRKIPDDVKRQVRLECGFGCVFDGTILIEYDHFAPEFSSLKNNHNAAGIALLCLRCHGKKTRGLVSNEQVAAARKNPWGKTHSVISETNFFINPQPTSIVLGQTIIEASELNIGGVRVLWFDEPEFEGAPLRLNLNIQTASGVQANIHQNELSIAPINDFDIECRKTFIKIAVKDTTVLLLDRPESKKLIVKEADLSYGATKISVRDNTVQMGGIRMTGRVSIRANGAVNLNQGNLTVRAKERNKKPADET